MFSRNVLVAAGLAVVIALHGHSPRAAGDDKKAEGPAGTWVKKGADIKVEFPEKEILKVYPHGDSGFIVICSYTLGKDGVVKAKIKDYEGSAEIKEKAKNALPVGLEFEFTWTVKDGAGKLDDVKGEKTEPIKNHLEGDYEKK
jgi:hypothetical protein